MYYSTKTNIKLWFISILKAIYQPKLSVTLLLYIFNSPRSQLICGLKYAVLLIYFLSKKQYIFGILYLRGIWRNLNPLRYFNIALSWDYEFSLPVNSKPIMEYITRVNTCWHCLLGPKKESLSIWNPHPKDHIISMSISHLWGKYTNSLTLNIALPEQRGSMRVHLDWNALHQSSSRHVNHPL